MKNKAKIFHFDLYGKREDKYEFLNENSLSTINWTELHPQAPELFFVPKDFEVKSDYDEGFSVAELFSLNNVGIVTSRDSFVIDENKEVLAERINSFFQLSKDDILRNYPVKENKVWKIDEVKSKAKEFIPKDIQKVSYRPFDNRFLYYNDNFVERSRNEVMQHFIKGENVGVTLCKQFKTGDNYLHAFITNKIIESSYVSNRTSEITSTFPLYLYPDEKNKDLFADCQERTPNLNTEIVNQIAEKLGLTFVNEKTTPSFGHPSNGGEFAPIDLLDYIYAVLHSPTYREKYKEFLKIDFPRVPYPKAPSPSERAGGEVFWQLVKLGGEIRQIHLLESPTVEQYITQYPIDGDNVVKKPHFVNSPKDHPALKGTPPKEGNVGKVYINETQYFDNVPNIVWEFYIGGYQPAQKWLKDRKDRKLEFDDILHYQKIIVALSETDRLMKEIDKIEI